MKKYIDIDKVISTSDMPEELWKYEELMREKPNWNKKPRFEKNFSKKRILNIQSI